MYRLFQHLSIWCIYFLLWSSQLKGQVRVVAPSSLISTLGEKLGSELLPAATATFGSPYYGDSFLGVLVYSENIDQGCEDNYKEAFDTVIKSLSVNLPKILVINRGGCTFVQKVRIAQSYQSSAVLFVDYQNSTYSGEANESSISSMLLSDNSHGNSIVIPSVMITYNAFSFIKESFQSNPGTEVLVQLIWSIPQKYKVSIDFWTESGSTVGQRFLKSYAPYAKMFAQRLSFTPHYSMYDLRTNPSQELPVSNTTRTELCWNESLSICANPPTVADTTITGRDIIAENLRQLCLYKSTIDRDTADITVGKFSSVWWDYVKQLPDYCPLVSNNSQQSFNEQCSYTLIKIISDENILNLVKACVQNEADELLSKEVKNPAWSAVALRIEGARYNSVLDPLTISRAVCSNFQEPPEFCTQIFADNATNMWTQVINPTFPVIPINEPWKLKTVLYDLIIIFIVFIVIMFVYKNYIRKLMRNSLRQEVMLEVRSQLQEYHILDDNYHNADSISPTKLLKRKPSLPMI